MGPQDNGQEKYSPYWPPPFRATLLRSEKTKTSQNVLAGKNYYILQEKKAQGYFVYLAIVLEDNANLVVQLDLDGQTLIDHSFNDLEAQAAGDLNLDTGDASGNLIHLPDGTASYYSVVIDASKRPWPFARSIDLQVKNITSTTKKIQGHLLIWSQTRAEVKHPSVFGRGVKAALNERK